MRTRLTAALALAGALAAAAPDARERALRAMQEVMGPMPARASIALDPVVREEKKEDGYTLRKIDYASDDAGDRVPAYLLIPDGAAARKPHSLPAILCLHQTIAMGKAEVAGFGTRPNRNFAQELARRGYVVIAPDYPGFGDYKIDVYAMGYASATMKGIRNHMRAVDVLAGMREVDARRIAAVGHSLGGHNSLFVAAFDRRIAAVVTSCGFTSFRKYYGGNLTGWSHKGYMPRIDTVYGKSPERMPFDFKDVLAAIAPRPIFVNAPLRDANFEWSGVDDAVRDGRAAGARVTVIHPDCEHDFPPREREQAYRFLDKQLRRR